VFDVGALPFIAHCVHPEPEFWHDEAEAAAVLVAAAGLVD
jgi:hypothetical protein